MFVGTHSAARALAASLWLAACATSDQGGGHNASTGAGTAGFTGIAGAGSLGPGIPNQPGFGGSGGPTGMGAAAQGAAGLGGVTAGQSGTVPGGAPGGAGQGTGASGNGAPGGAGASGSGAPGGGGNYFTSGAWHGYAWAAASGAGSTIDPPDLGVIAPGDPLCVSGTVGAAMNYSGVAMLGVNLNQEMSSQATMTVTPTDDGIVVNVDNRGGSPLRIQVQGPDGANDPMQRWCAPINGSGGFIAWEAFNTACWDNSGSDYAHEPIVAAVVMVPGDDVDPVHYDFCLTGLAEGEGGGAAGGGGSSSGGPIGTGSLSGTGQLTGQYDWSYARRDGRTYVVQNNVWGASASQTVSYNGTTFEVTAQNGGTGTGGAPVSYPSVFIGSNNQRNTSGSNLPKQVSALGSVQTGWSHNAGSVSGTYNAAYDVWFSTGSGGDAASPSGGYLMVWLYDPPDAQPLGGPIQSSATIPGISGSWDVWLGTNNGRPCISYVRTEATTSMEFDLTAFIDDATGRPGAISASWYLTNVFAGFEIWSGGVGLRTTAFYATVN